MRVADSYFVRLPNGTTAWLAVGKPVPEGAEIIEVRPVIIPTFGMILRHKTSGETSSGHWLRDGSVEDWEEIEEPENNSLESLK